MVVFVIPISFEIDLPAGLESKSRDASARPSPARVHSDSIPHTGFADGKPKLGFWQCLPHHFCDEPTSSGKLLISNMFGVAVIEAVP